MDLWVAAYMWANSVISTMRHFKPTFKWVGNIGNIGKRNDGFFLISIITMWIQYRGMLEQIMEDIIAMSTK